MPLLPPLPFQSGIRIYRYTETALIKVTNDLHVTKSSDPLCVFIPHSLTVFDPVGHNLFLKHFCPLSSEIPHSAGLPPPLNATPYQIPLLISHLSNL